MNWGIGDGLSAAKWVRRGRASAADTNDPNYHKQWYTAPGSETTDLLRTLRGFDGAEAGRLGQQAGECVIREDATTYYIDTPRELPPVPLGGTARALQRLLQAAAPPQAPRMIPKDEVTVHETSRGLLEFRPNDPDERPFYGRPDASLLRPGDQSARDQMQTLKDIWSTRRWGR